ncbi:MAG TPA: hypothetical protein PKM56_01415 [Candidatus Rifleibacterium sp.]|nr:hypothetical protein [Candidatus Rifleibacterium sp.]
MRKSYRKGSAFVIVIGVLGVILFASTMFMSSTVEEGRQTSISVRGLHATSLAEAALERAMRMLADSVNEVDPSKVTAKDMAIKLRLPAKAKSGVTLGLASNLGSDEQLDLETATTEEIILSKDDLQEGVDNKELDAMVAYMTSEGAKEYDVKVTVKIDKAFRVSPGNDYSDFKVPGVDISWNLRPDVKSFLDGSGYSPLEIGFPKDMSWLDFSIPIKIGPITLVNINLTGVVDKLMPKINVAGKDRSFKELTSLDFFADMLVNQLLCGGQKKYPISINFDSIPMPKDVSALWPAGVNITPTLDQGQYLEKYGQIKLECEASITYQDNYKATRRVSAIKDFKTADCEPPAPMYSFFIANLNNEFLSFNNYGGTFVVNNFDYSGTFSKIKELFTGPKEVSEEELKKREFPGLIRVNYSDKSSDGTKPLICNVALMGDWGAPPVAGDNSGAVKNVFEGIEALMILNTKTKMAVAGGKYNINAEITKKDPETNIAVPVKLAGNANPSTSDAPVLTPGKYGVEFATKNDGMALTKTTDYLKKLVAPGSINLVPDVGKMSTNVLALAVTLALKPMVDAAPLAKGIVSIPDCFQKWEMPFMGTGNSFYTIPTTGTGANKTRFFGSGGMHPTLTREVEGNVLKRSRQWQMCIVGLSPTDRLPLLPFPPVYLPPPPLVIPIWKAQEILTKYDYNLEPLKANSESGNADYKTYEYDPSLLQNMPPNLYTSEQYAKKATYYYESAEAFVEDLPNRMTTVNGKKVFILNGVTYISGSLGSASSPFNGAEGDFYVLGKGMIVCSGNFFLGSNIKVLDRGEDELTVFSLIIRNGGLLALAGGKQYEVEGSLYTDKGIYCHADSSIKIQGNWVTNQFNKAAMGGTVSINYVSSRVRTSLGSLHPVRGKFDPKRYHVSFSPLWASWRAY